MNGPEEFLRTVRELARARPSTRAMQATRLREALSLPWVDAVMAGEAARALAAAGLPTGEPWKPAPLGVGETYLLLYDATRRDAQAVRIRSIARPAWASEVFGEDARDQIESAYRGLLATVAAECRMLPPDLRAQDIELFLPAGGAAITGGSLGLSVCVALVSRALGRAPRQDVAATAVVRSDGSLGRVEHVREKHQALAARWPNVQRLIVAHAQGVECPRSPEIVERKKLAEALLDFGLDVRALPEDDLDRHLQRVAGFEQENARPHAQAQWQRLSLQAWESSCALAAEGHERKAAAQGRVWAAAFALHAGDPETAQSYLAGLSPEERTSLPPGVQAWQAVIDASVLVDKEPARAIGLAKAAIELSQGLSGDDRKIYGQALGTYGRALLHTGRPADAERPLRDSVEFHARELGHEEARSRVYLATCLRKLGRAEEALQVVKQGLHLVMIVYPHRAVSKATRLYLELERGRCLLELGRFEEAETAFAWLQSQQSSDSDYPRLGAVRGLAVAWRRLGRGGEADAALRSCLAIANERHDMIGQVAAVAAGEALLESLGTTAVAAETLQSIWSRSFPGAHDVEAIRAGLARWVY